jgi:hypothetical protein
MDNQAKEQLQDNPLQASEPVLHCMVVQCIERNTPSSEDPLARDWLTEIAAGCSVCTFIMDMIPNSHAIMQHVKDPYNRFSIHKCSWNEALFEIWGNDVGAKQGEISRRNNTIFEIFCKRGMYMPLSPCWLCQLTVVSVRRRDTCGRHPRRSGFI